MGTGASTVPRLTAALALTHSSGPAQHVGEKLESQGHGVVLCPRSPGAKGRRPRESLLPTHASAGHFWRIL